ncbi:unnamed protein product [Ceutorhynchus assimilis]|uniref:Factor VIII intron 22 protein n=1 Tax=Ceutorhynchus assimilis TaxID=467358 RepID=A0A9N9N0D4_9CUCU|nr:unnamed protein product [Ceutorhynchus assimilis]
MTSESTGYEVLDQYRTISNKLKKRFLRKPNETEASESFVQLANKCEAQHLPQYSALSWIAAARCEGTLGNSISENSYLLRAGRQFLNAEREDLDIGCTSANENLQAGLACFRHAFLRHNNETSLGLELIDYLQNLDQKELYLKQAVDLASKNKQDSHLHCLGLLGNYFIAKGDHVAALQTYQEIRKVLDNVAVTGYKCKTLLECEINLVFLLLILKPSPQNIPTQLAKILEKYTWGDQSSLLGMFNIIIN